MTEGKKMRFYVAGPFEERERMLAVMEEVRSRGGVITYDWTKHKPIRPYWNNPELSCQYAGADLKGVAGCEVFVLVPGESGGSGQFAELGVAIVSKGVKRIFVVGPHNGRALMFFHPRVERVASMEEVWKKLRGGTS